MSEPVVRYEERGSVAIVTLNRPGKMNTLTEEARRWVESFGEKGFREAIAEPDTPFGDHGQRGKQR